MVCLKNIFFKIIALYIYIYIYAAKYIIKTKIYRDKNVNDSKSRMVIHGKRFLLSVINTIEKYVLLPKYL